MNIIYRGRFYVGDKLITDRFFKGDDKQDMTWLSFFKEDTRRNSHPEARYEVTEFVEVGSETVTPEYPVPLVK